MSNSDIVRAFVGSINSMDWEAAGAALADDVVYHNMPLDKIEGRDAALAVLKGLPAETVDWQMLSIAEDGNKVLTERVDNFEMAGGKEISLPVMGTFEIRDGKISAWRDYFDLASYTAQLN